MGSGPDAAARMIELEAVRLEASQLRRGQTTTFPERLDISERAAAGQSDESRLRRRWAAPSGPCANGEASLNTRGGPV